MTTTGNLPNNIHWSQGKKVSGTLGASSCTWTQGTVLGGKKRNSFS
jgi:hypothetical protein